MDNQEQIEWDAKQYAENIPTKITELICELNKAHDEGYLDSLKTYVNLKRFEAVFESVKDNVYSKAIDEADKYEGKSFKAFGASVEKSSAGAKWDFKEILDWQKLEKDKKEYEEKLKTSYKMAENGDVYVTEGGEIVPVPKYTPGKTIIKVKIND